MTTTKGHTMTNTTAHDIESWTNRHRGDLYVPGRDVADVAKLVRKDLRAAGYKASVRISRYSGGCSLSVGIKAVSDERAEALAFGWDLDFGYTERSLWHLAVEHDVRAMVQRYQRSESNSMTDYCDYSFFDSITCRVEEPEIFRATLEDRAAAQEAAELVEATKSNGTTLPPLAGVAADEQPYGLARVLAEETEAAALSAHAGFLATLGVEA